MIMDRIWGKVYLKSGELLDTTSQTEFETVGYIVYEVIRVQEEVLLFLEDHIERMLNGLRTLGIESLPDFSDIRSKMISLLNANNRMAGNIKLLCKYNDKKPFLSAYYIPHAYPSKSMYEMGATLISYQVERTDPSIKQVDVSKKVRSHFDDLKDKAKAFEVVLIDRDMNVTEGSRSNIFFIKDNLVYSAPDHTILAGITRKYVINVIENHNIRLIKRPIKFSELKNYESAFLCGTSPRVMPIHSIHKIVFKVENNTIQDIASGYDALVNEYIKNNRNSQN